MTDHVVHFNIQVLTERPGLFFGIIEQGCNTTLVLATFFLTRITYLTVAFTSRPFLVSILIIPAVVETVIVRILFSGVSAHHHLEIIRQTIIVAICH